MSLSTPTPRLRFDGAPIADRDLVLPTSGENQPAARISTSRRLSIDAIVRRSPTPIETESLPRSVRKRCSPVLVVSKTEKRYLARKLDRTTSRELDVLIALCGGGTNDTIASELSIASATLRSHIVRLSQKLDVSGKSDLVRMVVSVLLDGYRTGALPRTAR